MQPGEARTLRLHADGRPQAALIDEVVVYSARIDHALQAYDVTWRFGDGTEKATTLQTVDPKCEVRHSFSKTGAYNVEVLARGIDGTGLTTMVPTYVTGTEHCRSGVQVLADPSEFSIGRLSEGHASGETRFKIKILGRFLGWYRLRVISADRSCEWAYQPTRTGLAVLDHDPAAPWIKATSNEFSVTWDGTCGSSRSRCGTVHRRFPATKGVGLKAKPHTVILEYVDAFGTFAYSVARVHIRR